MMNALFSAVSSSSSSSFFSRATAAATFSTFSSSSSSSSSSSFAWWRMALASLAPLVWARDHGWGLCRVNGASMEPTLRAGDVVLVRKSEAGILLSGMRWNFLQGEEDDGEEKEEGGPAAAVLHDPAVDRARLLRVEHAAGAAGRNPLGRLYESPPVPLPGDVVVFKDPGHYVPILYNVKRVLAVGGQHVRVYPSDTIANRHYRLEVRSVPPYFLHVEGDNQSNSLDSRQRGPITKNLLVGIVEAVVWPPSRMGRIRKRRQQGRGRSSSDGEEAGVADPPRAYWP